MRGITTIGCVCVGLQLACGSRDESGDATGTYATTNPFEEEASSGSEASSSTTSNDDGDIRLDLAGDTQGASSASGGSESSEDGCKKIDFLFVVDNSGSMQDEQQNLVNSFGGFITTIQSATGARDFHIMAIDTDSYLQPGGGSGLTCSPAPSCCTSFCGSNPGGTCNGMPCTPTPPPMGCDQTLGGGKLLSLNGTDCGVDSGFRYMLDTQADLAGTFACVALVGTDGDGNEKTLEAASQALGPLNAVGACNAGFVRDDAVLVLTLITDEEDDHETMANSCNMTPGSGSAGEPQNWFDAVVATKLGVEQNIVVLSLIGPTPPDTPCPFLDKCNGGLTGADQTPRIVDFTHRFTRNLVGPVCADDYTPFFEQAVALISSACDEFVPPS